MTLDELAAETERRRNLAERIAAGVGPEDLAMAEQAPDLAEEVRRLEEEWSQKSQEAADLGGQLKERAGVLSSVPEAEEELEAARAELARVERLQGTLERTRDFLLTAQDRAHRNIAPTLQATIEPWLPRVTKGRYQSVTVDPESLTMAVAGGTRRWRNATLLSHGTREQIYLLLRVAMAQHLTKEGEVCPLILDDVTIQCDEGRTVAILELLRDISTERQVVCFSQEATTLVWARKALTGPNDATLVLDANAIPA